MRRRYVAILAVIAVVVFTLSVPVFVIRAPNTITYHYPNGTAYLGCAGDYEDCRTWYCYGSLSMYLTIIVVPYTNWPYFPPIGLMVDGPIPPQFDLPFGSTSWVC
jgi:hypothetical protein